MPIVSGSLNYSYSGRKRKSQRGRKKVLAGVAYSSPSTFRRDTPQYPSADMAKARHDNTSKEFAEKQAISSKYTVAPAYNKGAYQVISRENVKDIGK